MRVLMTIGEILLANGLLIVLVTCSHRTSYANEHYLAFFSVSALLVFVGIATILWSGRKR
jgi:hypothetical protein